MSFHCIPTLASNMNRMRLETIKKILFPLGLTTMLSGCVGLDVVHLAATATNQSINIVANADSDIEQQEGVRVYDISMTQQAPLWVKLCHYDGILVEYARDWEESQPGTDIVSKPQPDKPIGYALLLTKERCPNKDERAIFSLGTKSFYGFNKKYVIREGHRIDAIAYEDYRKDARPRWLPQVLNTVERSAPDNVAARNFLIEMEARTEFSTIKSAQNKQP